MSDTFPRQYARTQRLSLGEPRTFTVSGDGRRVVFVRSRAGDDPVNALWVFDVDTGTERLVFDPRGIDGDTGGISEEEKRRRERAREGASGVVGYSCDSGVRRAVTVVGGQVVVVDLEDGTVDLPGIAPGVFDVRFSPDGRMLSFVRGGALCVATLDGVERVVADDPSPTVSWGKAEFIAAEEMGRFRGSWWSPDSRSIAACRVEEAGVPVWHIADPAHPGTPAVEHRYPHAGAVNATVELHVIDVSDGTRVKVDLPGGWEYLNTVSWTDRGLIAQVQTRDQRRVDIHAVDPSSGACAHLATDEDGHWVELMPGVPALLDDGRLLTVADRDDARRLCVDSEPATPDWLQVRSIIHVGGPVVFVANHRDSPWIHDVWTLEPTSGHVARITDGDGVCSAHGNGHTMVVRRADLESPRARFTVHAPGRTHDLLNHAETALVEPRVRIVTVGPRSIPVAILVPNDGGSGPLPVLFDPYGGPHAQRVVAARSAFFTSQWFADQGFVVVVADNAGTPGKGAAWERAVAGDLAAPVIADQVEVLDALSGLEPRADLSRVAIRGWSFGGYLAALAVLRHGGRFHAAVAGAPVTDWALYDTHYTERYLGMPGADAANYARTNLVNDVAGLSGALLLIHGLADDNVVAAHTLQLSSALLAAGKPHEELALSGVTHMTPQEEVAENLLLHQLDFLRRHLGA